MATPARKRSFAALRDKPLEQRELFEKKKARAAEVFGESFTQEMLYSFRKHLNEGHFRRVWIEIDKISSRSRGGQRSLTVLMQQLNSWIYSNTVDILGSINELENTKRELNALEHRADDGYFLLQQLRGIRQLGCAEEIKKLASRLEDDGVTYAVCLCNLA